MEDLIRQFEQDLKAHLERVFNASLEPDAVRRLDQAEKTVFDFVDGYLLESALIAKDVEGPIQNVMDQFASSKISDSQ